MTEQESTPVAILYWGTKGGPVRQLNNLLETSIAENLSFHWIFSSNIQGFKRDYEFLPKFIETPLPKSKFAIAVNFTQKKKVIRQTIRYLDENNIKRVFFLMPHPWDLALAKNLKTNTKIEIWRAVHDLERHPGDIWPTRLDIKKSIRYSDVLVAFSPYVSSRLNQFSKKVIETNIYERPSSRKVSAVQGSVLFIGRIRKYKGLKLLKNAWPLVKHPNKGLTIAGEGRGIPFKQGNDVRIVNRWLTDREIEELIDQHSVVVLPYIEASQSGLIPLAASRGVPVVVTPVGGLRSQLDSGVQGLVSAGMKASELAIAIDVALSTDWSNGSKAENHLIVLLQKLKDFG